MPLIDEMEIRINEMVDELQGQCATYGLANQASEEQIISNVFLYKFLNDKFMYNLKTFAADISEPVEELLKNENDELDAFYDTYSGDVAFAYEDTIEYLGNRSQQEDFAAQVQQALDRISNNSRNERFRIETASGRRDALFDSITADVEDGRKNAFVRHLFSIITKDKFNFEDIAASGHAFDFYSSIFEHLISKYNVAAGTYAEYFTPQAVSRIIAKILVGMSERIRAAEIYDAAAGSGSLVLHLAHELGQEHGMNRAIVYTQDISPKSTRFLRLNMMLNGMTESLGNIIRGDTLLDPAHFVVEHDPSSGLKKFDYITINPPFKMDFSATRNDIEHKWADTDRFFAGVPKIPAKKKESMAIYTLFIQHVMYSLKANGKAAIVVPTGFLTAANGIEKVIREKLVNERMLKGVISMPSNIFANTGTSVSVLFLDKGNTDGDVFLMDASKMGIKVKEGKNQRTVLSEEEIQKIIATFIQREQMDDFSVVVNYEQIKERNYSFAAGQYFAIKIEHVDITPEEFQEKMTEFKKSLDTLFKKDEILQKEVQKSLELMHYGN